jgi:hypothetical protein
MSGAEVAQVLFAAQRSFSLVRKILELFKDPSEEWNKLLLEFETSYIIFKECLGLLIYSNDLNLEESEVDETKPWQCLKIRIRDDKNHLESFLKHFAEIINTRLENLGDMICSHEV